MGFSAEGSKVHIPRTFFDQLSAPKFFFFSSSVRISIRAAEVFI